MPDQLRCRLDVLDANDAVSTGTLIPVESVQDVLTRQPVVISIPSTDKNGLGDPVSYALDFGMAQEQMILTIICADQRGAWDTADDGTIEWPSKPILMELCRRGWRSVRITTSGGQIRMKGGWRITIDEGATQGIFKYQGLVLGATASREGGETHWTVKITFQVVNWPPERTVL